MRIHPGAFLFLAAAAFIASATPMREARAQGRPEDRVRIAILHTNDMHGGVKAADGGGKGGAAGGFARIHAHVLKARKEMKDLGGFAFLVDAGDFFQGTPEGGLGKGAAVLGLMNRMGYDAAAPGNHEYDHGRSNFEALAAAAKFPFLSANIEVDGAGGPPPGVKRFAMLEAGPVKVGFFGLITADTPLITFPGSTAGLGFRSPADAAVECVAALRAKGADVVVAITHMGAREDAELASSVKGIDLVIGGHSHTILKEGARAEGTGTLIAQAGANALFIGRVDIAVNRRSMAVEEISSRAIPLHGPDAPEDAELSAEIGKLCRESDELMDSVAGLAAEDFASGGRKYEGRSSPMGNLIADAVRIATSSDLAFENRGGIRAGFRKGPISLRDVFKASPFQDSVVILEMKGSRILMALAYSLESGARFMLEISGGEVVYSSRGDEAEIKSVKIGDEPLDPDRIYRVAMSSFVAAGGDGHQAFADVKARKDTGLLVRDLVAEHIRKSSPVRPDETARIGREK